MNHPLLKIAPTLIGLLLGLQAWAQSSETLIYGTITTIDDMTYTGQIRWGKEEAFWSDHLNVGRTENENLDLLSRDVRDQVEGANNKEESSLHIMWVPVYKRSWYNEKRSLTHRFVCRFGDVQSLKITGRNKAMITLRNGETIDADGSGFNDIGTEIIIVDQEMGEIKLDWDRIHKVDFSEAPGKLQCQWGEPLYGMVNTKAGAFEGYVIWDMHERLSADKLDGNTDDGRLGIEFENISKIVNNGNSSMVTMKSGRELDMSGTNDVNKQNKGIVVVMQNGSRVKIAWDEFKSVEFAKKPAFDGMAYSDFQNQKEIKGSLTTSNGNTMKGPILFDMDERFDFEMIQGTRENIDYFIPISLVESIAPRNHEYSFVQIKGGEKLLLGSSQDLTDKNHGVLVFTDKANPQYVAWKEVEKVTFD